MLAILSVLFLTFLSPMAWSKSVDASYSEATMMELESVLGPIEFETVTDNTQANLIKKNAQNFARLRQAILPFHQFTINIATDLKAEINVKNQVDPLNFSILDRALFGYQAILRKLTSLENAYSEVPTPSQEIRTQVALAQGLTSILGADVYSNLFNESKTRRMFKDLLDEERPKQEVYSRRNQELQLLFIRSLEPEFRRELAIDLRTLPVKASDLAPFKLSTLAKTLDSNHSFSQFEFSDALSSGVSDTTYLLSKLFGSIAGNIKFRKGHFYQRQDVTQYMAQRLEPFDILFDKAPFALTDRFIPGHYTHAAIYLGTKAQLQKLGLWNLPALAPYKKDIEAGKVIAEAIRPGSRLATLAQFQNVDEIAAYRVKNITADKNRMAVVLKTALAQIGKEYDFNFDVSTTSVIVCSELVYHSHANINWPTEQKVGRETITPDNLAETAFYQNSPIDMVFDIHADLPGDLVERSKVEVAKLLGFSEVAFDQFEKDIQVCQNVKKPYIRVGSRRDRHLVMRQCHQESKEIVYN